MKNFILAALLLGAVPAFTYEPRILDKTPRSMGMGGVGVSTFGYTYSPLANPAALGLMADDTMVPILDVGFGLNDKSVALIKELTSVINGGKNITNINFDQFIGKMATIGVNSPLSLGFMGKGFGVWMNMGSEANFGVYHPADSPLRGVKVSTALDTVNKVTDIYDKNGGINAGSTAELEQTFKNGIYQDLKNDGLSDAEIYGRINGMLGEITGISDDFFSSDGTLNESKINAALGAVSDGGKLNIPIENLSKLLPRLNVRLYSDIAVNIGYGYKVPFRALDDVSGISFGATVRFIQRFKSDSLSNVDPVSFDQNNPTGSLWQAFSVTSDFGLSLRLQNFVLGFAVRDAFSAPFQWRGLTDKMPHPSSKFLPSIDLGASYRFLFKNPWIQEVGMYFEAIDMMNKDIRTGDKIRLGAEIRLFRFLDLRLGMYDLFVTGGLGMGGKWGRIEFAYYRESYQIYKGYFLTGDTYSVNIALGLENTSARKAATLARKQERARLQRERQAAQEIQDFPVETPLDEFVPS